MTSSWTTQPCQQHQKCSHLVTRTVGQGAAQYKSTQGCGIKRLCWHGRRGYICIIYILKFLFNWRIFALQCCIGFCCSTVWNRLVIQQRGSALRTCISPPSRASPAPRPGSHQLQGIMSSLYHTHLPTSSLFYTWEWICASTHPTLPFPCCVHGLFSMLSVNVWLN